MISSPLAWRNCADWITSLFTAFAALTRYANVNLRDSGRLADADEPWDGVPILRAPGPAVGLLSVSGNDLERNFSRGRATGHRSVCVKRRR